MEIKGFHIPANTLMFLLTDATDEDLPRKDE